MQKWEYTNLYAKKEDGKSYLYIGNRKVKEWGTEGTYLLRTLNELGEQGWEVVLRQDDGVWLLKRSKSL